MSSLFSLRPGVGQPRLTTAIAAGLDRHDLQRSTEAMEALWRAVPLGEPWTANDNAHAVRPAR